MTTSTSNQVADVALRSHPPVRDQGPRGTCAAFATTAAHEHRCSPANARSEEHAYWLGRRTAPIGTQGAAVSEVLDGLRRDGQLAADQWPYGQPPPDQFPSVLPAGACPLPTWSQLPDCTFRSVKTVLDAGAPVVLSLAFAPDIWFAAADGWLEYDAAAPLAGGHAVLAVAGVEQPTAAVLLRNSWGAGWGRSGHAWAPAELIDAHGIVAHALSYEEAA